MLNRFTAFARRHFGGKRGIVVGAVLGFVLTTPSLTNGFNLDDHFLRMVMMGYPGLPGMAALPNLVSVPFNMFVYAGGSPEANHVFMDHGLLPWWAYDHAMFRRFHPLVGLSLWLDHKWFGDLAWLGHLHSLLWYVGLVVAAGFFYRRLLTPAWVAGLATVLYAIDDAHGTAVGWIANRNAFVSVLFGVITLTIHDRWRRDKWRPGAIAAPLMLIVGLLFCESAVATCAYLGAYMLCMDRAPWLKRLATMMPYGVIIVAWQVYYHQHGYGVAGSAIYIDMGQELGLFLKNLPIRLPLVLAAHLVIGSPAYLSTMPLAVQMAAAALAFGIVVFIFWTIWPLLKQSDVARYLALGMVISLIPMCGTMPGRRLLFFPGIGGIGLIALGLHAMAENPALFRITPARKKAAALLGVVWIVTHAVLAPITLPVSSKSISVLARQMERGNESAPSDPGLVHDTAIIVSAPSDLLSWYLPIMRSSLGQPAPAHCWALTTGMRAVDISRPDECTLIVAPEGGFAPIPWGALFRDPEHPVEPGYSVHLSGVSISVLTVTNDGRPATAKFVFDKPLEDPSWRWITWSNKAYIPFTPPRVGASVRLPEIGYFFWV